MYDEDRGTPNSKLPVPEPSDIERATSLKFDEMEADLKSLKTELNGNISYFKDGSNQWSFVKSFSVQDVRGGLRKLYVGRKRSI